MIFPIDAVDLRLVPGRYPFSPALREKVAAEWQKALDKNPHLWNGRILSMIAPSWPGGLRLENGLLSAELREDAYMAWRAWGFPEIGIRNGFGSGLIQSSDGYLIYGQMGGHTANAGAIYPPGGSLEPRDVRPDGTVDVFGSIDLEIAEETGLDVSEAEETSRFVVFDGPKIAICRVLRFNEKADDLAARIRANLPLLEEQELADVHVLRDPDSLPSAHMPGFAVLAARHVLLQSV